MAITDNLEKLLAAGQDNAMVRFGLGNAYLQQQEYAQAIEHLRAALAHDRHYSAAWKLYAKALAAAGLDGEAIAAYLQRARPSSVKGRPLFVRVKAAHQALTPGGVTQVVVAASRRAGLPPITAHRLRHTAATELLRAGAPLVEIGQLLRHRSELTTAIYANVDLVALKELARPWPGGAW